MGTVRSRSVSPRIRAYGVLGSGRLRASSRGCFPWPRSFFRVCWPSRFAHPRNATYSLSVREVAVSVPSSSRSSSAGSPDAFSLGTRRVRPPAIHRKPGRAGARQRQTRCETGTQSHGSRPLRSPGCARSPGRRTLSRPAVSRALPQATGRVAMPSQQPLQALSPWSRRYAIAADARLMRPINTAHPRESAAPVPRQPTAAPPSQAPSAGP